MPLSELARIGAIIAALGACSTGSLGSDNPNLCGDTPCPPACTMGDCSLQMGDALAGDPATGDADPCANQTCGGNGQCHAGSCTCDPGYTGFDCSTCALGFHLEGTSCVPDTPPPASLPVGIPTPTFGYLHDTDIPTTIYVDNTNGNCDNSIGSASQPLCDLFRGGNSVGYAAGDVVEILGGPYAIAGDKTLTANGTLADPVIIKAGSGRILFDAGGGRVDFDWLGSYLIVEGIDFFHSTRHSIDVANAAFRNIAVHNPVGAFIDFNPVVNVTGSDVLIYQSEIFNNRRNNDTDSHGIQVGSGGHHVWVLDNELYNNNGDSFQSCHLCFSNTPHHVYIGRNVMHEDRENGVDLKTVHDVVISENTFFGYGDSATSNGDAVVIGSNGFDASTGQGPRRIWVINNQFFDSSCGIRIEGSDDVHVLGNEFHHLNVVLQVDNKTHSTIVVANNTIDEISDDGIRSFASDCDLTGLRLINNIVTNVTTRHIDVPACAGTEVANNILWNDGGGFAARLGTNANDLATLNGSPAASGNLSGDPQYIGDTYLVIATSIAVDAGLSIDDQLTAFQTAHTVSIAIDRGGEPRPAGLRADIGAYER